jgi:hypothetical protein
VLDCVLSHYELVRLWVESAQTKVTSFNTISAMLQDLRGHLNPLRRTDNARGLFESIKLPIGSTMGLDVYLAKWLSTGVEYYATILPSATHSRADVMRLTWSNDRRLFVESIADPALRNKVVNLVFPLKDLTQATDMLRTIQIMPPDAPSSSSGTRSRSVSHMSEDRVPSLDDVMAANIHGFDLLSRAIATLGIDEPPSKPKEPKNNGDNRYNNHYGPGTSSSSNSSSSSRGNSSIRNRSSNSSSKSNTGFSGGDPDKCFCCGWTLSSLPQYHRSISCLTHPDDFQPGYPKGAKAECRRDFCVFLAEHKPDMLEPKRTKAKATSTHSTTGSAPAFQLSPAHIQYIAHLHQGSMDPHRIINMVMKMEESQADHPNGEGPPAGFNH